MIPHLYSNACFPISLSINAPVVSRKKFPFCSLVHLELAVLFFDCSMFHSHESKENRAFLKLSLSVMHFLKQLQNYQKVCIAQRCFLKEGNYFV